MASSSSGPPPEPPGNPSRAPAQNQTAAAERAALEEILLQREATIDDLVQRGIQGEKVGYEDALPVPDSRTLSGLQKFPDLWNRFLDSLTTECDRLEDARRQGMKKAQAVPESSPVSAGFTAGWEMPQKAAPPQKTTSPPSGQRQKTASPPFGQKATAKSAVPLKGVAMPTAGEPEPVPSAPQIILQIRSKPPAAAPRSTPTATSRSTPTATSRSTPTATSRGGHALQVASTRGISEASASKARPAAQVPAHQSAGTNADGTVGVLCRTKEQKTILTNVGLCHKCGEAGHKSVSPTAPCLLTPPKHAVDIPAIKHTVHSRWDSCREKGTVLGFHPTLGQLVVDKLDPAIYGFERNKDLGLCRKTHWPNMDETAPGPGFDCPFSAEDCPLRHWKAEPFERQFMKPTFLARYDSVFKGPLLPPDDLKSRYRPEGRPRKYENGIIFIPKPVVDAPLPANSAWQAASTTIRANDARDLAATAASKQRWADEVEEEQSRS